MAQSSHSLPRDPRRRRDEVLLPIAGVVIVSLAGALVGGALDWGAGAYWAVFVVAGVVGTLLMARGAVMHAPRRTDRPALRDAVRERRTARSRRDRQTHLAIGINVSAGERSAGELQPRKVIALAGPSGSRKSSIAEYSAGRHGGWARASCGAYVRSVAREKGIPDDPLWTHDLGQQLVEELGGRGFLDAVLAHASLKSDDVDTLLIDDIYHLEVFDALKERWDQLRFVAIDLPPEMRRRVMEDRGVPPEKVDELEHSKLESSAVELLRVHGKDLDHLQGAVTQDEVAARSRELFELVAV